jgi:hypothetical protein
VVVWGVKEVRWQGEEKRWDQGNTVKIKKKVATVPRRQSQINTHRDEDEPGSSSFG